MLCPKLPLHNNDLSVAVDAVSSEPVSAEFPVKQGINREFSQNHPLIRPVGSSNRLLSLVFSNSLKNGTGNFFSGTGNLIPGTGNYLGGSGNHPTVRLSFKSGARNRLYLLIFGAGLATIR